MKKIIRLTESDLERIVKRVIEERLSVSDTGELVGDVGPDHKLVKVLDGISTGNPIDKDIEDLTLKFSKKNNLYKFGILNIDKNDYVLLNLDKNNGEQLFEHPNKINFIIFKNGFWYDAQGPKGPFTLGGETPSFEDDDDEKFNLNGVDVFKNFAKDKKFNLNDLEIFHNFAKDMTDNGINKYFVIAHKYT